MRLGTKILILTLAITLGLAGTIVWVVSRDITAYATDHANEEIHRAVSDYFDRLESLHEREVYRLVKFIMEDPRYLAELEAADNGEQSQLQSYVFGEVVQRELSGHPTGAVSTSPATRPIKSTGAPAFHVLVNFEGRPLIAFAPNDPKLTAALSHEKIEWPFEPLLADEPVLTRRYVWLSGGLYLALGNPLRLQVSGAPTHAYFIGYRINDAWAQSLLGDGPRDMMPVSERQHHPANSATSLGAWFVVNNEVIARGATSPGDETAGADSAAFNHAVAGSVATWNAGRRGPISFTSNGEHFIGEAVTFDLPGGGHGALAVASSLTRALGRLHHLQATIAWVTAGVVVIALIAFRFVSNFIAKPVSQLVAGTRRVARGEFDEPIAVNRSDELGELASSFNEMAVGLQQRDLVKSTFGKFVDPKVVEGFLADPSRLMPGGEKRVQTVLFSDLRGFTSFSEKLEPDDLVSLLNEYLGHAADVITEMSGVVDKFIGDAVVGFWGPPINGDDEHAGLGCVAALRIVRGIRRFDAECERLGVPPLGVRVGAATGEVLVGIIGSANKYNYTVMGDTANLGSRLEGLNKIYGTSILVTGRTAHEARHAVVTRRIDRVRVMGRGEVVELFEVLAECGESNDGLTARCAAYAEALGFYEQRDWPRAAEAFRTICRAWPDDGAAAAMAERCAAFQHAAPDADWDGVWNATSK